MHVSKSGPANTWWLAYLLIERQVLRFLQGRGRPFRLFHAWGVTRIKGVLQCPVPGLSPGCPAPRRAAVRSASPMLQWQPQPASLVAHRGGRKLAFNYSTFLQPWLPW